MGTPVYMVDAFAAVPFWGNPAAVCLPDEPRDERWMQLVAREMNVSETAFISEASDGYALRWFTPAIEVDMCGHATLAGAHVLWESGRLSANEPAVFHTACGILTAYRTDEGIALDFPSDEPEACAAPPQLIEALGVQPTWTGKSRDYVCVLEEDAQLYELAPDFAALARVDARGVVVTSRASRPEFDFVSRCFYPAAGIDEDPVTGSAHCALAPYWSKQLGKQELLAYQASSRGGLLRLACIGDRVLIEGQACTVWEGMLRV